MRYLTLGEIFELHRLVAKTSGGATGIRDLAALESAVAQPKATFDMIDLFRLFRVTLREGASVAEFGGHRTLSDLPSMHCP